MIVLELFESKDGEGNEERLTNLYIAEQLRVGLPTG